MLPLSRPYLLADYWPLSVRVRAAMTAQRNQSLDVLRCIAVLLVLGVHDPYYHRWALAGWVGVDLFFVLSGFLISGLLFTDYKEHGSIDWKRFLIRRGFKIYPSFYVLLAATGLILGIDYRHYWFGSDVNLGHALRVSAIFLTNYRPEVLVAPFGHLWSVAVEEHFYLMLPGLLILLTKRRGRDPFSWILILFPVIALTCFALRWFTVPYWQIADATHLRIDSLFAGVTLGYLYHFRREWFDSLTTHWSLVGAIVLCSPAVWLAHESKAMQTGGLASLYVGFALLVAWSIDRNPRSKIGRGVAKSLATIGFYSYSIYLWHSLLATFFTRWAYSAVGFWFYVALSLNLGIVTAKLIELPALALRERLFPAGQRVSAFQNRRFPIMITSTMLPSLAHVGGVESSDRSK